MFEITKTRSIDEIPSTMARRIAARLDELEETEGLRVIYACESGSRAWGFPSQDSDFDVRFLYVRPVSWYLSVFERKDVIEDEVDRELDLGGWDVRKALGLMRKGNAPLLEWLTSPLVYRESAEPTAPLRDLMQPSLLPESVCHHYLAQARRMMKTLDAAEEVKLKTYLYAMRCLAAARWVADRERVPPMDLGVLLGEEGALWPADLIAELLAEKARGTEADRVQRRPELDRGLKAQHDDVASRIPKNPPYLEQRVFDRAFLDVLRAVGVPVDELSRVRHG